MCVVGRGVGVVPDASPVGQRCRPLGRPPWVAAGTGEFCSVPCLVVCKVLLLRTASADVQSHDCSHAVFSLTLA